LLQTSKLPARERLDAINRVDGQKSWEEFTVLDATELDFAFTVLRRAACSPTRGRKMSTSAR
jgi:hypothetical protein